MMHGWIIWVILAAVLLVGVLGWFLRRPSPQRREVTWLANASYLTSLPSFKSRLNHYKVLLSVVAVILVGATVATSLLAARPVDRQVRSEELATRDIVLCLDVSGSMLEFDSEIVERFLELLPNFNGERVALSIWNSTSSTVFPLTDDYQLIEEELTYAADVLDFDYQSLIDFTFDPQRYDRLRSYILGTIGLTGNNSSLVGDGLATCAFLFDEADTERSRSIILATDNQVLGTSIYTLSEAADLVAERDIMLFGIYAGASTPTSAGEEQEYRDVVEGHGGLFLNAADPALVPAVVDEIAAQQAVDLEADVDVVITDRPERYFGWLVLAMVVYVLAVWRVRT